MMARSPRCGVTLRFAERPGWSPVLEDPVCGRRAGHRGQHRTQAAMARQRRAAQAPSGSPALAAAIRAAREQAGISQRSLAAVLGVTPACVQLYEYAKRTPSPETWVQLELTLGPLGAVRDQAEQAARETADDAAA
jgi:ribosome-binding protein aMBF1 (putative translation factor)